MPHTAGVDLDGLSLAELRQRRSAKWSLYGEDVLPLWVAELDVPLAPCVTEALERAVRLGDTGYAWTGPQDGSPGELALAFAGFARRRWGWDPDVTASRVVADVMSGVAEVLQVLTAPGDGVVVCPPVYHPFFAVPPLVGRAVVEVPLVDGALDLPGIDRALREGARAVLLCSPHNPTGRVWTAGELADLDAVVR
ncbi:MAG: aminotransferase class I/II-fold pyridoxal phosphate-dependent enzyme, partial [Mycobacteriales bacterium]